MSERRLPAKSIRIEYMEGLIALVPARGGSKGIPRKNIAPLAGKPLLAWTIQEALKAQFVDRVVVSTDDEEIASVARQWGAEVPFIRPAELAADDTPAIPVLVHAMDWLTSHWSVRWDYVLILQATSPLRTSQDIDRAVALAREKDADAVISMCAALSHPYWAKKITDNCRIVDFLQLGDQYPQRQVLPPLHVPNGAIYLVKPEVLRAKNTLYTERTYAYVMPTERSLDIDSPWDLYVADLILTDRQKHDDS
jgi:CMP-N,N'-diacetyllegionaminic acid synthase